MSDRTFIMITLLGLAMVIPLYVFVSWNFYAEMREGITLHTYLTAVIWAFNSWVTTDALKNVLKIKITWRR